MSEIQVLNFLKDVFGFDDFKCPIQRIGFDTLLSTEKKNVIISMKSFGGKTLCYQMAGAFQNAKPMIVICSSLATMRHQKAYLNELGFRSESVDSSIDYDLRAKIIDELQSDSCSIKFFFITPEMLEINQYVRQQVAKLCEKEMISHVIVDDVHLMMPPVGLRMFPDVLKELRMKCQDVMWVAIGSITDAMISEISSYLGMTKPCIIKGPLIRNDLFYKITQIPCDKTWEVMLSDINSHAKEGKLPSGIIYVNAINETLEVSNYLITNGIDAKPFNATMETRFDALDDWINGKFPVIVATEQSLGFGNVKIPVKFVVHYHIPDSFELFYHLSGRANDHGQVVWSHMYTYHSNETYYKARHCKLRVNGDGCRHKTVASFYGDRIIKDCRDRCDNCVSK